MHLAAPCRQMRFTSTLDGKVKWLVALIAAAAVCAACTEHYDIGKQQVSWNSWNEGSGSSSRPLTQADRSTFQILRGGFYAKDSSRVFFKGRLVPDANAGTFVAFDQNYAKDGRNAFYYGQRIEGVDAATFQTGVRNCDYCWRDKFGCGTNNYRLRSCSR